MKRIIAFVISIVMLTAALCVPFAAEAASVAKVTSVSASSVTNNSVKLKWKKVKGATGYQVYCSTNKSKNYKKVKTIKKGKTVSAKISSLKANKKYYFKVRAVKKKKTGKFSKIVAVKTKANPKPKAQNILSVLSSGSATWKFDSGRGVEILVFVPSEERVYYTITGKLGEEDSYSYYWIENNKLYFQLYNEGHYSTETNEVSLTSNNNQITVKKTVLFHAYESYETYQYTFYRQ